MNKAYCLHVTFGVMPAAVAAAAAAVIVVRAVFRWKENMSSLCMHNVQRAYELVKVSLALCVSAV